MRRSLILAGAAALSLGGCATPGTGPNNVADVASQIATYTAAVCAFEPSLDQIIALIDAYYPAGVVPLTGVTILGDVVCKSPQTAPTKSMIRHARARTSAALGKPVIARVVQTPRGPLVITGTVP